MSSCLGQKLRVDCLRLFECIYHVLAPRQGQNKLEERALNQNGFMGTIYIKIGYQCYNLESKKFSVSSYVKFNEKMISLDFECKV